MNKIIVTLALAIISNIVGATESPASLKPQVKSFAIDQLVEVMTNGPFYKITEITISEAESDAGVKSVSAVIYFDDSLGCTDRFLDTTCLVDNGNLGCFMTLSDCLPLKNINFSKSIKLK